MQKLAYFDKGSWLIRVCIRFLAGAVGLSTLFGCEEVGNGIEIENYPTMDNMLEIDGNNLRVIRVDDDGDKASITIGESDTRWCDITVDSRVLSSQPVGMNTLDGSGEGLSAECQWNSDYYVQSSKHHTSVAFNLTDNQITADLLLVNPTDGNFLALTGVALQLPDSQR